MGHWYTKSGEANHFQANGSATTLRHARKENLYPSVTEIIKVIDKPALTNWKLKQVTREMYESSQEWGHWEGDYDSYHKYIMETALGADVTGRDRGSDIHKAIEDLIGEAPLPDDWEDNEIQLIADGAVRAIEDYTGQEIFIPETIAVNHSAGYAGMIDAHNDDFVIDWKTKDITGKKLAYPENAMQLAAYSASLKGPGFLSDKGRRCLNVFVDRTEPGKVVIHEWSREDLETAWEKFKCLLKYWQLANNYKPEFKGEA